MKNRILLIFVIASLFTCHCITSAFNKGVNKYQYVEFNKVVFESKDSTFEGTIFRSSNGRVDLSIKTIDFFQDDSTVINETYFPLTNMEENNSTFGTEKYNIQETCIKKANRQKTDTIDYYFSLKESTYKKTNEHDIVDENIIANESLFYSYIANVFGNVTSDCIVRIIYPNETLMYSSVFFECSAYIENKNKLMFISKQVSSTDITGFSVVDIDTFYIDEKRTHKFLNCYDNVLSNSNTFFIPIQLSDVSPCYVEFAFNNVRHYMLISHRLSGAQSIEKKINKLISFISNVDYEHRRKNHKVVPIIENYY